MLEVFAEDALEVALVSDQEPIEALARTVRTKRSAQAFATGVRIGVRMIRIPSLANTVSMLGRR